MPEEAIGILWTDDNETKYSDRYQKIIIPPDPKKRVWILKGDSILPEQFARTKTVLDWERWRSIVYR